MASADRAVEIPWGDRWHDRVQCQAATSKRTRCKNVARYRRAGAYYCGSHAKDRVVRAAFELTPEEVDPPVLKSTHQVQDEAFEAARREGFIPWPDVYARWRIYIPEQGRRTIPIVDVPVPPRQDEHHSLAPEVLDWWPAKDFDQRRALLAERGVYGVYWNTRAGVLQTARSLWQLREDEERSTAVLIAASIQCTERPGKDAFDMLAGMRRHFGAEFGAHFTWHHATEALPDPSADRLLYEGDDGPRDWRHVVRLAALDVAFSGFHSVLVRVVARPPSDGIRAV